MERAPTVRGVPNTVAAMVEPTAVSIRLSNAWLRFQETADFAREIQGRPAAKCPSGDFLIHQNHL